MQAKVFNIYCAPLIEKIRSHVICVVHTVNTKTQIWVTYEQENLIWATCAGSLNAAENHNLCSFQMLCRGFNLTRGKRHFQALSTAVGLGQTQNEVVGFIFKEGHAKESVTTIEIFSEHVHMFTTCERVLRRHPNKRQTDLNLQNMQISQTLFLLTSSYLRESFSSWKQLF